MMALSTQWMFMYTDTPQDRVVKDDGREIKNTNTSFSGRAQIKMMAAEPQLETESTVRLHPKLSAFKQVMSVVLILVPIALQLDPGTQRMAKVAVKQGGNVLPGCTFDMVDTGRLSKVEDGLFRTVEGQCLNGMAWQERTDHPPIHRCANPSYTITS